MCDYVADDGSGSILRNLRQPYFGLFHTLRCDKRRQERDLGLQISPNNKLRYMANPVIPGALVPNAAVIRCAVLPAGFGGYKWREVRSKQEYWSPTG